MKIKARFFKWFFLAGDRYKTFLNGFTNFCRISFAFFFILFVVGFLFYIGFNYSPQTLNGLQSSFRIFFLIIFILKYAPEIISLKKIKGISLYFRLLIFIFSLCVFLGNFYRTDDTGTFWKLFSGNSILIFAIFMMGISEISGLLKILSTIKIPPALIFSFSFLFIILFGSGLLLLPKAHIGNLSYLDSLFTSVSAVCVTGLVTVDTATGFTRLGQIIILCLIQVGGLGIMTFTGFFSYIFTSSSSFRDKMFLKEIFSLESLNNLFKLLVKIILFTFLIEISGALVLYFSLDESMPDQRFFSIFHSVSAFCNAGFSNLSEGLNSPWVRNNNAIYLTVAFLIILGGIGFPLLITLYSVVKHSVIVLVKRMQHNKIPVKPGKKDMPMIIVLYSTIILLFTGTFFYYLFESHKSLEGYNFIQKIVTSFFGSVSARTAGFNIADISVWSYPTLFLMILLMWIGASPGSTGGGIKTTTFTLAILSTWNNLRGRDHFRLGNREIGSNTIERILSIIILSILIIITGFFCLLLSEPSKDPLHLLFECFSAFGTVGLSLADTGSLSHTGKIIVVLLMFIGRVGPLTLFTGFFLAPDRRYFRYPELEIIIN